MNEIIGVLLTLIGAAYIWPHIKERHELRKVEKEMPTTFSRSMLASLSDRELIRYADQSDQMQRELSTRLEIALDIVDAIKERTKPTDDQHECCF